MQHVGQRACLSHDSCVFEAQGDVARTRRAVPCRDTTLACDWGHVLFCRTRKALSCWDLGCRSCAVRRLSRCRRPVGPSGVRFRPTTHVDVPRPDRVRLRDRRQRQRHGSGCLGRGLKHAGFNSRIFSRKRRLRGSGQVLSTSSYPAHTKPSRSPAPLPSLDA